MNYASALTRDYLEYLGITEVSRDGTKVMKGDKELIQHYDGRYKLIALYDPAIRKATPTELRRNSTGQIYFGVHRIVYCWHNRVIPTGMVIDHINSNKLDNRLENLQLLSPKDNINKEREESTKEMKCQMNKPRSFYEDKLVKYEALYEAAKEEHNADLCHSLRANISQTRARIRYWDNHKEEYFEYTKQTESNNEHKEAKKQSIKDRKILEQYKDMFRRNGNKNMWHQLCDIINKWDTLESKQKEHVFEVLNKHFTLPEQFES